MRAELRFGPAKTGYTAPDGVNEGPIATSAGQIPCSNSSPGMGCAVDANRRAASLLNQVESRGHHVIAGQVMACSALDLPLGALLRTVEICGGPKATFGAVFLITRPDWEKRLNALQDHWAVAILGTETRQKRAVLLMKSGPPSGWAQPS